MKYIALLRGINVGGKNKVAMPLLKESFGQAGFKNVSTYINSGNVFFESDIADKARLVQLCEKAIEDKFGFSVVCSVISSIELKNALENAPQWWGKGEEMKHNAIFVVAPATAKEISAEVGEAKPEYEKISVQEPIIFWSAPLETFNRTRYSKIIATKAYQSITIRNYNTTRKLVELVSYT